MGEKVLEAINTVTGRYYRRRQILELVTEFESEMIDLLSPSEFERFEGTIKEIRRLSKDA